MAKFKVTGVLALDGTNFQAGMTRAQAAMRGLGNAAVGSLKGQLAAAFSIGAVTMLSRRTMEYADTIDETASRIGVGVEKLQEWSFAAKQAGSSTEQLAAFVERLTMAALDPNKQAIFKRMGITPAGMTSEGLFEAVSRWSRGRQSTEVTPLLRELTGVKGVGALLNTLQTDLDAAGRSARQMGAVMDSGTTQKLAKLNDQFSVLSQILYTQFGPAVIWAAGLLLKSFGQIQGAGAYWGTVFGSGNFSRIWGQIQEGAFKGTMDAIAEEGEKMWRAGMPGGPADAAFQSALDLNKILVDKWLNFDPNTPPPGKIGAPVGGSATGRSSLPDANAQMRVGNFLGVGQSNMQSLAQMQLAAQQATMRATQEIARLQRNVLEVLDKVFF